MPRIEVEAQFADGNRLIDFATGIATLNVGHTAPEVVAAAQRQLELEKKAAHFRFRQIGERRLRIRPVSFTSRRDERPAKQSSFHDYAEAIDRFAAAMDLARCRERSASFDKLCLELTRRLTAEA